MDLTTLTDDQLNARRIAVMTEQERRAKLAQLPDQLATMALDAAEAGCDPDELIARVTVALTPGAAGRDRGLTLPPPIGLRPGRPGA